MVKARSHDAQKREREIRAAKQGNARDAIGELRRGHEVYILTFGQFSMVDAITTILEQTGPAHVAISTWTAADAHLEKAAALLEGADILSMRWLVDRSFLTRQPEYCEKMRHLFGDNCIRTLRTHAKFVVITNDQWNIAIRTSMNLNENPRLESIEISDDADLAAFMLSVVDDVFGDQAEGVFNGELPTLDSVENVNRAGAVAAGRINPKTLKRPRVG